MNGKDKFLFIGPRNSKDGKTVGGIVVLFEDWIDFVSGQEIGFEVVDTNKSNYRSIIIAYVSILHEIIKNGRNSKIMLHGTFKDYLYIGPIVCILSKVFGQSYVLRKFAGNFKELYEKSNSIKRKLLSFVVKNAAISYWETRSITEWAKKISNNAKWFPNVRNAASRNRGDRSYSKKFVFISRVTQDKGIDLLMEAFAKLGDDYSLDIYGPLDGYEPEMLAPYYKGILKPSEIINKLVDFDVMLLPTSWVGEGYPGIIIESLSAGLPVIATSIGGISEIIDSGYNGIIMCDNSADSLIEAIHKLEVSDYKAISKNAIASFKNFDTKFVSCKVLEDIKNI